MIRRRLDPDRATGQRRFTDRAFCYPGYQSADLAYAITGGGAVGEGRREEDGPAVWRERLTSTAFGAGWVLVCRAPESWSRAAFMLGADIAWRRQGHGVQVLEGNLQASASWRQSGGGPLQLPWSSRTRRWGVRISGRAWGSGAIIRRG